jgi:hypothetical protein
MIIGGLKSSSSRRRYRMDNRKVQLIHIKPSQPLRWSEQPITFSKADHWVHIPDPGSYPLVVEPIVEGALLPQTLINGGSGLNVIFVDTLLMVNSCIKVRLDLKADKSPVIVKGPFFPRVVNPRY